MTWLSRSGPPRDSAVSGAWASCTRSFAAHLAVRLAAPGEARHRERSGPVGARLCRRGRSPTGRGRALKPPPVRVRLPPSPLRCHKAKRLRSAKVQQRQPSTTIHRAAATSSHGSGSRASARQVGLVGSGPEGIARPTRAPDARWARHCAPSCRRDDRSWFTSVDLGSGRRHGRGAPCHSVRG